MRPHASRTNSWPVAERGSTSTRVIVARSSRAGLHGARPSAAGVPPAPTSCRRTPAGRPGSPVTETSAQREAVPGGVGEPDAEGRLRRTAGDGDAKLERAGADEGVSRWTGRPARLPTPSSTTRRSLGGSARRGRSRAAGSVAWSRTPRPGCTPGRRRWPRRSCRCRAETAPLPVGTVVPFGTRNGVCWPPRACVRTRACRPRRPAPSCRRAAATARCRRPRRRPLPRRRTSCRPGAARLG